LGAALPSAPWPLPASAIVVTLSAGALPSNFIPAAWEIVMLMLAPSLMSGGIGGRLRADGPAVAGWAEDGSGGMALHVIATTGGESDHRKMNARSCSGRDVVAAQRSGSTHSGGHMQAGRFRARANTPR